MKKFAYESLMDLMEEAESLGWVDGFEDETGDYDGYVADAIEEECISVLLHNGYEIVCS